MEVKRKRIKLSKIEQYTADKKAFGWQVAAQEDLKPNNTVVLILERDREQIPDYRAVRSLEKQYFAIRRPFSLPMVICAGIGTLFLILYFATKSAFIFYFIFLYLSLTFFFVASFALAVFLFLLIKKKKILALIKEEAAARAGTSNDWPNAGNIMPENQESWALSNMINNQ